ncbi:hypothetical protein RHMOL_Rhmol01G0291200 [Rhododendron molle]|uniref:Uncharacterized protein n=1 Tax=Rhododendron molle TaxID=49168 RepID=A0ACC0Q6J9_RHOML|nr:hypothetical protein RHMOL_Rhmol01G0291200 [Rhododendron molle]
MLRPVRPSLNFWYYLGQLVLPVCLTSFMQMDFVQKISGLVVVLLLLTTVISISMSFFALTMLYIRLLRNPETESFFYGYERAGKTTGYVLVFFGNVGLYYYSEKSVACMLTFLFLAVYCLSTLFCIQPYTDFGVLEFLLSASMNQALSLFGIRSYWSWIVIIECIGIGGMRYCLEPMHPRGEGTGDQLPPEPVHPRGEGIADQLLIPLEPVHPYGEGTGDQLPLEPVHPRGEGTGDQLPPEPVHPRGEGIADQLLIPLEPVHPCGEGTGDQLPLEPVHPRNEGTGDQLLIPLEPVHPRGEGTGDQLLIPLEPMHPRGEGTGDQLPLEPVHPRGGGTGDQLPLEPVHPRGEGTGDQLPTSVQPPASNFVLSKLYFWLRSFFHGYERAGKTTGYVLVFFGNIGLGYYSEKSVSCITTSLFLVVYCLSTLFCIQPYKDFGVLSLWCLLAVKELGMKSDADVEVMIGARVGTRRGSERGRVMRLWCGSDGAEESPEMMSEMT